MIYGCCFRYYIVLELAPSGGNFSGLGLGPGVSHFRFVVVDTLQFNHIIVLFSYPTYPNICRRRAALYI